MVLEAVDNIDNNRTTILNRLNTFTPLFGNGNTPLSETFYEAALYLRVMTSNTGESLPRGEHVLRPGSAATPGHINHPSNSSVRKTTSSI